MALGGDYYCIASIQPLMVYTIPAGTPFPSNCYNSPQQTGSQTPQSPPSNSGQTLGKLINPLFSRTSSSDSSPESTASTSPRPQDLSSTSVPAVIIVANPSTIETGEKSALSWASVFTRSCAVTDSSGVRLVENGKPSDSIATPALSVTTVFTVLCTTNATSTVSASTTIKVQ